MQEANLSNVVGVILAPGEQGTRQGDERRKYDARDNFSDARDQLVTAGPCCMKRTHTNVPTLSG